jgi:hypothetical protein
MQLIQQGAQHLRRGRLARNRQGLSRDVRVAAQPIKRPHHHSVAATHVVRQGGHPGRSSHTRHGVGERLHHTCCRERSLLRRLVISQLLRHEAVAARPRQGRLESLSHSSFRAFRRHGPPGKRSPVGVATGPVRAEAGDPEHSSCVGLACERLRVELFAAGGDKQRASVRAPRTA